MKAFIPYFTFFCVSFLLLITIDSSTTFPFLLFIIAIGIAGAFVGTLVGGGGLITLPAMLLIGVPIHVSIATNKFSSSIGSLSSLMTLYKSKQLSSEALRHLFWPALLGGIVGAFITTSISEYWLHVVTIVFLSVAFIVSILSKQAFLKSTSVQQVYERSRKTTVFSFIIGLYDGGFGPGSSTFNILYFIKMNYTYVKATQLNKIINFGGSLGGFLLFFQTGFIQWDFAIALAIGSIIGTQIGLRVVSKIPLNLARWLVVCVLTLLIIQVARNFI